LISLSQKQKYEICYFNKGREGKKKSNRLVEIFENRKLTEKIKRRLPYLFQLAESESSRAGKIGMEVGSLRERIIVALLIHIFGKENITTEIPITKPEVNVRIFNESVSIKTIQHTSLKKACLK